MHGKVNHIEKINGLQEADIPALQQRYGKNVFQGEPSRRFLHMLLDVLREPMFILLAIACTLYFILQQNTEGFMMLAAMALVTAISLYQDARSTKALKALKQYTEPKVSVIRDGKEKTIAGEDLVPGDIMLLEEGRQVPADALVVQSNDLTVNESVISGESLPVDKYEGEGHNILYQGATINSGKCLARVTATGNRTVLGKLGKEVAAQKMPQTLLQRQTGYFVKRLALFGLIAFAVVWLINYLQTGLWVHSLLFGLTLAMAALPEEIPVAFSSFMALGAYRMSRLGIISRHPQAVENLGTVSVVCLDKTGTITENKMAVVVVYDHTKDVLVEADGQASLPANVLYYAMLASETQPFDAMEKAILEAYHRLPDDQRRQPLPFIYEYALQGRPPMMTHVYKQGNTKLATAKGAAEKILQVCRPGPAELEKLETHIKQLASKGYRVLGVASAVHDEDQLPQSQEQFNWKLEGLLCLYDPPKKNMRAVIQQLYDAHIRVMLLTGDHPETAVTIAEQTGIKHYGPVITGEQVMNMDEQQLRTVVRDTAIFARMFPEAKQKVVQALKANGEITAMTGDGVNDGPALKAADVGIAMGHKGTAIARLAADLILTDDNPEKITAAISEGRKIFSNLKKAIRYIISIHIPIILTAVMPLLLGWQYPNIFTPIHVIFLELIMGPTCSLFFEREPAEQNSNLPLIKGRLFSSDELLISTVQGIIIAIAVLMLYYFMMQGHTIQETRSMVFITLILANIFLTFANRSFVENFTRTVHYKNNLAPWVLLLSGLFLAVILLVPAVRDVFGLAPVSITGFLLCLGVAFVSVVWFELYKTHLHRVAFTRITRLRNRFH